MPKYSAKRRLLLISILLIFGLYMYAIASRITGTLNIFSNKPDEMISRGIYGKYSTLKISEELDTISSKKHALKPKLTQSYEKSTRPYETSARTSEKSVRASEKLTNSYFNTDRFSSIIESSSSPSSSKDELNAYIGSLEITYPETIKSGTSKNVTLKIKTYETGNKILLKNPSEESENLKRKEQRLDLPASSSAKKSDSDISVDRCKELVAVLKSNSFDIVPEEHPPQPFNLDEKVWTWNVKPKQDVQGEAQNLLLSVYIKYAPPSKIEAEIPKEALSFSSAVKPDGARNRKAAKENSKSVADAAKTPEPINLETLNLPNVPQLTITVDKSWFDWMTLKLGGLATFITGLGLSFPFFRDWLKDRSLRTSTNPIGFTSSFSSKKAREIRKARRKRRK